MSARPSIIRSYGKGAARLQQRGLATQTPLPTAGPSGSSSADSASTSSSASPSSSSIRLPLKVSLILSRQPLIRKVPNKLEAAYHRHSSALRLALANPVPEDVYFSKGSLSHRRFQKAHYETEVETFGPAIAGKAPGGGEVPPERPVEILERDHWVKADAARGERSLERRPDDEIYCVVRRKDDKKWGLPVWQVTGQERLHNTVDKYLTGVDGVFDGKVMDTWLVTKKPIGHTVDPSGRTFFLRSHILAGEPQLPESAPWDQLAWLSRSEFEARLSDQGDVQIWEGIKGMFGVPAIPVPEVLGLQEDESSQQA